MEFVSRAGQKLEHALITFGVSPSGLICADLGANVGGFTDCLLQFGGKKIYAIDTGYGTLEYKLRKDGRVVVMERTNAMHVTLPEAVELVTIDVAWTKQKHILPAALNMLSAEGQVVTLIKPHYEADPKLLRKGVLPRECIDSVLDSVRNEIESAGFQIIALTASPITGSKGNAEFLVHLRPLLSSTAAKG
jgi:23S rRNA (cytidine1920-2'-O)/16S rRNA (cytidine1409-2'-O)-methyltransferase